jgi:hypothetical protein
MKVIAHLVEVVARLVGRLQSRPLWWYLLLLVVAAAGPFGIDLVFLVDLVAAVGVDVFVLSMLYYISGSVTESVRAWRGCCARFFARQGGLLPREAAFGPRPRLLLYLGHNLCVFVTPTRLVTLALLCFAIGPALSWLGASHVA